MIKKITIELSDGTKYNLKRPSELEEIDKSKPALFLFDSGEIFNGCTDGETDEDGKFAIFLKGKPYPLGFPVNRLIGWAYLKDNSQTDDILLKSIKKGGEP